MAYKSWKPKNNNYIDGAGIRVNRKTLLDYIFPVGSVFLTVNKVNPGTFLGGTWEQMSGGYVYLAGNSLGKTDYYGWGTQSSGQGNTGDHVLTISEMPSHTHDMDDSVYGGYKNRLGIRGDGGGSVGLVPSYSQQTAWSRYMPQNTGGGQGHSHPIYNHSHNIATIDVFAYKRIA